MNKIGLFLFEIWNNILYFQAGSVQKTSTSPRESMRQLPKVLQPFLTLLTGKPLPEEKSWQLTPWHHLFSSVLAIIVGVFLSIILLNFNSLWLIALPWAWLVTVHGIRKNRTVIMHQCSHHNFTRHKKFDRILGKIISIILISEEFDHYQDSHLKDHHSSRHQTIMDPTVAFLFNEVGLRPGMTAKTMWIRLFLTISNPVYHLKFIYQRLKSHFISTSLRHKTIFIVLWSGIALFVTNFQFWWEFLIIWFIPICPLYQISTAFRLASEHVFPRKLPTRRTNITLGEFTIGIFMGSPCPNENLPFWQRQFEWCWWWIRMLLFHLPARLFILPGDGSAHDFHHRYPCFSDWANFIHHREKDLKIAEMVSNPYREVWGIHRAIEECFKSLSEATYDDYVTNPTVSTINL